MAMQIIGQPTLMPDGRYRVLLYDAATGQTEVRTVGDATDPVAAATQAGQAAAAQTQAIYGDPWYQENVTGPMNRSVEAQAKQQAETFRLQARQMELQGRQIEANILNQKAQIAMRKAELAQQGYFTNRGQQLQAAGLMLQARGPGNAAQAISLGERLSGFGAQTDSLVDIANGRMPQGAFIQGSGGKPTSMEERMSGMLGAPSHAAIDERDRNDRALATRIMSAPNMAARGSIESLGPYRQAYLKSYGEAEGFDWDEFNDQYKRAGIMQGRR